MMTIPAFGDRTPEEIVELQRTLIATLVCEKVSLMQDLERATRERDDARFMLETAFPDEGPLWFGAEQEGNA